MAEEPNKDDKKHKTCKSRRETAVQGTNDNSIVSKCSMAAIGYFDDVYLQEFVSKVTRRAPLIHRGYYIRAMTIDYVLRRFLTQHQGSKQIVSLGAGFDSAYFRLRAEGVLENVSFYEVDFPEVVKRKCGIIRTKGVLSSLIPGLDQQDSNRNPLIEINTPEYTLVGVDLTQLNTLEAVLIHCGIDTDRPTLLLSECVLTYMTRRCSSAVLRWAAETFSNAVFVMYEQINPNDAFGLFMQRHFQLVGSPLRCITAFPTLKSQQERFLKLGWERTEALDMNQICTTLVTGQARHLVESIEPFDEYEEWHLKCSHYMVMCGYSGVCGNLLQDLTQNTCEHLDEDDCGLPDVCIRSLTTSYPLLRFGHSSAGLHGNDLVITVGGFGEQNGKHRRLIDVVITNLRTLETCILYPTVDPKIIEVNRMHHMVCAMKDNSVLLIGGRTSPIRLCSQIVRLNFIGLDNNQSSSLIKTENTISDQSEDLLQKVDWKSNGGNSLSEEVENKHLEESNCSNSVAENVENKHLKDADYPREEKNNASVLKSRNFSDGDDLTDVTSRQKIGVNSGVSQESRRVLLESNSNISPESDSDVSRQCGDCKHETSVIKQQNPNSVETRNSETADAGVMDKLADMELDISVIKQSGDIPSCRWRHSALVVNRHGREFVLLFGGRTEHVLAHNDMYILDPESGSWSLVVPSDPASVPVPRQALSMTTWGHKVIISGGLDADLQPLNSVHMFDVNTSEWETLAVKGNLLKRYSHTSHMVEDHLLLMGGVNFDHTQPGVALIHLPSGVCREFPLPAQNKDCLVMLHRHTSVYHGDYKFVVVGGGGNCFSFGTHLNATPLEIDLTNCFRWMADYVKSTN